MIKEFKWRELLTVLRLRIKNPSDCWICILISSHQWNKSALQQLVLVVQLNFTSIVMLNKRESSRVGLQTAMKSNQCNSQLQLHTHVYTPWWCTMGPAPNYVLDGDVGLQNKMKRVHVLVLNITYYLINCAPKRTPSSALDWLLILVRDTFAYMCAFAA